MKTYFFVANMPIDEYDFLLDKIELMKLGRKADYIINKYYYKIGVKNIEVSKKAAFLEAIVFADYYANKLGESLEDLEFVNASNFFIYNEKIFVYQDGEFIEIKDEVRFVTSRDSWFNIFFHLLDNIAKKNKKINLLKPNFRKDWVYNDKLYYINKFYNDRENIIGDVVVPFFMKVNNDMLKAFFFKLAELMGDKLVLKHSFGEMGKHVKPLKVSELNDEKLEEMTKIYFDLAYYRFQSSYIVPWYDIDSEFRVYFRYDKKTGENKIYSSKIKLNTIDGDVFAQKNMEMYKTIGVKRKYFDNDEFENTKKYANFVKSVVKHLENDSGVMEICELKDGTMRYIELNNFGGSLMFPDKDEKKLQEYYFDLYDMINSKNSR